MIKWNEGPQHYDPISDSKVQDWTGPMIVALLRSHKLHMAEAINESMWSGFPAMLPTCMKAAEAALQAIGAGEKKGGNDE